MHWPTTTACAPSVSMPPVANAAGSGISVIIICVFLVVFIVVDGHGTGHGGIQFLLRLQGLQPAVQAVELAHSSHFGGCWYKRGLRFFHAPKLQQELDVVKAGVVVFGLGCQNILQTFEDFLIIKHIISQFWLGCWCGGLEVFV